MNDEILKRIDALATKLGVTADHIWAVLVKQAGVEFKEWIVWASLWFILSICLAYSARWIYKKFEKTEPELFMFAAAPGAIALVLGLGCLGNTMTLVLNPEYWALTQITKMIGGK